MKDSIRKAVIGSPVVGHTNVRSTILKTIGPKIVRKKRARKLV